MKFIYPIELDSVLSEYAGSFTNSYRANDGAIDFAMTGIGNTDAIRFTLSAAMVADSVAIYVESGTGTANIHKNFTPSASLGSGSLSAGWNIITFTETTSQYWNIVFSGVSSLEVSEIFVAYTFDFAYRYDLGHTHQQQFGVDLKTSKGGGEFANKRHDEIFLRNWNNRSYSETNKTNYQAMLTDIGGIYAKLLWYDDSSYHWIRLQDIPAFREDTFESYSFGQGIRSQLQ